ncbi:unnamed protein product [Closterium sp. Yama58-4]|nr:unnamed protein product [Closterium sp. Yama58-4]
MAAGRAHYVRKRFRHFCPPFVDHITGGVASQILVPLLLQDFDINWKPSSPPSKRARLREFKHFIPHDGHEWLKYGQKDISGGRYSRHYFRCSHSDNGRRCPARRVVDVHTQFGQPGASDLAPRVTYSGKHNHAQPASRTPSENESLLANPIFPTERAKLAASVREQQQAIAGHMFPLPRAQLQQLPGSEKRQQHATTLDLSLIRSGLAKEDGERCDNESCPLTPTTPTSLKPLSLPLSAPLSPQLSPPPSTPVSLWTPVSLRPVSSSSVILPSPRAAAEEAEREAGELQTGLVKGKRKRPMLAETGADDTSRADAEGCQGSEISLTLDHGVLLLPGKDLETSPVTLSDPLGHGLLQAVTDRANASNMFDTCDLGPLQADPTEACPNGAAAALPKSGSVTRLTPTPIPEPAAFEAAPPAVEEKQPESEATVAVTESSSGAEDAREGAGSGAEKQGSAGTAAAVVAAAGSSSSVGVEEETKVVVSETRSSAGSEAEKPVEKDRNGVEGEKPVATCQEPIEIIEPKPLPNCSALICWIFGWTV